MSEAPEAVAEAPAVVETPEIATPDAPEASQHEAHVDDAANERSGAEIVAEAGEETAPEAAPAKKSPVAQLQGRVGHLTKTLHEKDTTIADQAKQLETYKALLDSRSPVPEGEAPVAAAPIATPAPGSAEFDKLVQTAAQRLAVEQAFAVECNKVLDSGKEKFGAEFEEARVNLVSLGLMNEQLVEAALATDAPADVLHYLGTDLDEAARITSLPPIRMAAEITKLGTKLAVPAEQRQISRAPAPINPLGGGQQANNDVSDPGLSDEEYYRRRAASGAKFIRAPK